MKILYFYQYFSTPKGSWGTRVYEFACDWVKKGHEVTVVTSVYSKSDIQSSKLLETQWFEGIQVKIINVRIDNKQPILLRFLTFIIYALFSSWYALNTKADVVIASSGPITVGIPGLLAHYVRRKKLIFETRDLWPEGAIELGIIKNKYLKQMAYAFERMCYQASNLIVTLSPGMKQYIEKHHGHTNVISVTNAANITLFSTPVAFPKNMPFEPKKYAIYTGNIGEVNNALWMVETAKILKERGENRFKIVLIGDGQQKDIVNRLVIEYQLNNLVVLNLKPKEELIPLIQQAAISLVPLKGTPVLDTSSPNKFFESLAAGVPVIQTTDGWMKDFVEQHQVGFTVDPNNPASLAECLLSIVESPEIAEAMGRRGSQLAKQHFDKTILAQQMLESLLKVSSLNQNS